MIKRICRTAKPIICILEALNPLLLLGIRLWLANIFLKSAILKLPAGFLGIGQGNWSSTLLLFEYEHPVPFMPESWATAIGFDSHFLPANVAAVVGTGSELIFASLIAIGLFTRLGAFVLILMTALIELTYVQSTDHIHWGILLMVLLIQGGGRLTVDYYARKKYLGDRLC